MVASGAVVLVGDILEVDLRVKDKVRLLVLIKLDVAKLEFFHHTSGCLGIQCSGFRYTSSQ